MNDFQNDLELIRKVLSGTMSSHEGQSFEERLGSDAAFKALFEEQRLLREAVLRKERRQIWDKVRSIDEAWNDEEPVRAPMSTQRYFYWAAAAVAMLIIGVIVFYPNSNDAMDDTLLAYYAPYAELPYTKPRGGETWEEALGEAAESYRAGEYEQSLARLKGVEPNDHIWFMRGLSAMGNEGYNEALQYFNNVSGEDFRHADALYWYKALCHLALRDAPGAESALQKIEGEAQFPVKNLRESISDMR